MKVIGRPNGFQQDLLTEKAIMQKKTGFKIENLLNRNRMNEKILFLCVSCINGHQNIFIGHMLALNMKSIVRQMELMRSFPSGGKS